MLIKSLSSRFSCRFVNFLGTQTPEFCSQLQAAISSNLPQELCKLLEYEGASGLASFLILEVNQEGELGAPPGAALEHLRAPCCIAHCLVPKPYTNTISGPVHSTTVVLLPQGWEGWCLFSPFPPIFLFIVHVMRSMARGRAKNLCMIIVFSTECSLYHSHRDFFCIWSLHVAWVLACLIINWLCAFLVQHGL